MISGEFHILIPCIQDIIGDPDFIVLFWRAAQIVIGALLLYIVSEEMYLEDATNEIHTQGSHDQNINQLKMKDKNGYK